MPFAARTLIDLAGIVNTLLVFGVVSGAVIVFCSLQTQKCPDNFHQYFNIARKADVKPVVNYH